MITLSSDCRGNTSGGYISILFEIGNQKFNRKELKDYLNRFTKGELVIKVSYFRNLTNSDSIFARISFMFPIGYKYPGNASLQRFISYGLKHKINTYATVEAKMNDGTTHTTKFFI